jgi:hypothetical protein
MVFCNYRFYNRREEIVVSYQESIDWEWNNFGNPAQVKCIAYIISYGPPPKVRGNISAHECVVNAIRAARDGNRHDAVRWLMAGQCHNDDAAAEIERSGNAAVDYALERYGSSVP